MTTTRLFKHAVNGWTAETSFENVVNGMGLEVRTVKRSSGILATTCHAYTTNGMFKTFDLFSGYRETLVQEKARATEKSVSDQHKQALAALESSGFQNMIKFYAEALAA